MEDLRAHALILLLLIASLSVVGRWLPWPQLITYLLGGVLAALLPVFPRLKLDPGFFFLCFLPPLLFADGWLMPLREFVRAKRPILTLAIGLVIFTTLTVGLVACGGSCRACRWPWRWRSGRSSRRPTPWRSTRHHSERLRVLARLTTVLNGARA